MLTVISIGSQAHAEFVENTDITSYVNSLIEKNKTITIPDGNYLVSATKSIQLKDNSTLKLSPILFLTSSQHQVVAIAFLRLEMSKT